jgi:hypothetical protein
LDPKTEDCESGGRSFGVLKRVALSYRENWAQGKSVSKMAKYLNSRYDVDT